MKYAYMAATALLFTTTPALAANLLVNGNFEGSTSQTATPPGWTNIGHTDGVIAYSLFGTPAFDGNYYYDIGGFGGALPSPGDGIQQSVATGLGQQYTLSFGYTGENAGANLSTILDVFIGTQLTTFTIVSDASGAFKKAFTLTGINYTAVGATTTIKFVQRSTTGAGNNDALIDGVIFDRAIGGAVPEATTWAMMLAGFGIVGAAMRRRRNMLVSRFA
jgi:PEP-CTERM motif